MTASWLARRERPKSANAASPIAPTFGAVLVKGMPGPAPRAQRVQWVFPADCASPKAPTVGALANLGRSES
jgi:hypothetical protein